MSFEPEREWMHANEYLVRVVLWIVIVASLAAAFGWQRYRLEQLRDQIAVREDSARKEGMRAARGVTDTIEVRVAADADTVLRTVTRVRVDTLMLAPKTAADTATAVAQLPQLAIEHDKLQRECTSLALDCTRLRAAYAAERDSTDRRISGLEQAVKAKSGRHWFGAPDLVAGAGACATRDGLRGCMFVGVAARLGP